jgi:multiple sugar transport system substrate-binding protein
MGVLAPEIQAALLGKKPVDQALSDAAKAAAPLLG